MSSQQSGMFIPTRGNCPGGLPDIRGAWESRVRRRVHKRPDANRGTASMVSGVFSAIGPGRLGERSHSVPRAAGLSTVPSRPSCRPAAPSRGRIPVPSGGRISWAAWVSSSPFRKISIPRSGLSPRVQASVPGRTTGGSRISTPSICSRCQGERVANSRPALRIVSLPQRVQTRGGSHHGRFLRRCPRGGQA